jgi:hypothetical protein
VNQTRLGSLIEAVFNLAIGFSINFTANLWLIPVFVVGADGAPAHIDWWANWWMGCAYTVISLVRQFAIRRWFNSRLQAAAQKLAGRMS